MLSVIVPAYNLENYIEECIQSICTQTYSDIEIIVINDGSVDKTGEICDRLNAEDKRIHVIHQSNKGVMAARIRGVNEAKGKWISFVDGDDYLDRNMYSAMLSNCAGSDLITCGLRREENILHKSYWMILLQVDMKEMTIEIFWPVQYMILLQKSSKDLLHG